jgi:hypothetical protein
MDPWLIPGVAGLFVTIVTLLGAGFMARRFGYRVGAAPMWETVFVGIVATVGFVVAKALVHWNN